MLNKITYNFRFRDEGVSTNVYNDKLVIESHDDYIMNNLFYGRFYRYDFF